MSDYPSIDDYILNTLDIQPEDYDSYEEFLSVIENEFGKQMSSAVNDSVDDIWSSRIGDYDEDELTPETTVIEAIDNIMRTDIVKREQTVQVLETAEYPFTIKEFVEATGMNPNTARRELGQGAKKGLFKRIGRGKYQRL